MINNKWFTLIELLIWTFLVIIIMVIFWVIVKQSLLFINYSKDQIGILNETSFLKQEISNIFINNNIKILEKNTPDYTGLYSIQDNVVDFPNPLCKDTIIMEYSNSTSTWIYFMWLVDHKSKKIIPIESDDPGLFSISNYTGNSMTWIYDIVSNKYINNNLNILQFKYNLLENWKLLRIDILFDNNLQWNIDKNSEFYYTGNINILEKVNTF
jgi:hypothetical protein